jgi:hypothetical protein
MNGNKKRHKTYNWSLGKKALRGTLDVLFEDLSPLSIKLGSDALYVSLDVCDKLLLVKSNLFLQVATMIIIKESRK